MLYPCVTNIHRIFQKEAIYLKANKIRRCPTWINVTPFIQSSFLQIMLLLLTVL